MWKRDKLAKEACTKVGHVRMEGRGEPGCRGGKGKGLVGLLARKGGGKGKGGLETLVNLANKAAEAAMLSLVIAIGLGRRGWGRCCSIILSPPCPCLLPEASSESLQA